MGLRLPFGLAQQTIESLSRRPSRSWYSDVLPDAGSKFVTKEGYSGVVGSFIGR